MSILKKVYSRSLLNIMLVSKSTYIALIKYFINLGDYLNKTTYDCSFIQVIFTNHSLH